MEAREQKMLWWAKTTHISEALQWWDFIEIELKESILRYIIQRRRKNFVSHGPTAKYDATIIRQLKTDVLSFSMLVKVKWQEYDLLKPKAQDVLANFDIGESQTSQQP